MSHLSSFFFFIYEEKKISANEHEYQIKVLDFYIHLSEVKNPNIDKDR